MRCYFGREWDECGGVVSVTYCLDSTTSYVWGRPYVGDNEDHHEDMTGYGRQRQKRFVESNAYIALPYLSINPGYLAQMHSEAKNHKIAAIQ